MSGSFTVLTIFEIIIAAALIIGLFNEGKLADFEESLFKKIKRLFCKGKGNDISKKVSGCRRMKPSAGHSGRKCA